MKLRMRHSFSILGGILVLGSLGWAIIGTIKVNRMHNYVMRIGIMTVDEHLTKSADHARTTPDNKVAIALEAADAAGALQALSYFLSVLGTDHIMGISERLYDASRDLSLAMPGRQAEDIQFIEAAAQDVHTAIVGVDADPAKFKAAIEKAYTAMPPAERSEYYKFRFPD